MGIVIASFLLFIVPPILNNVALERARARAYGGGRNMKTELSSEDTASDDEEVVKHGVLPEEDVIPAGFHEQLIACMPTVSRGGVEYVSNAVKSWRLATNGSTSVRRLLVFDMDSDATNAHNASVKDWVQQLFERRVASYAELPSWLQVQTRPANVSVRPPRKDTLGDSPERVRWRSKEAQDYAHVLRQCVAAAPAGARHVLIVQDDVLFRTSVADVAAWASRMLVQRDYTDEEVARHRQQVDARLPYVARRGRVQRICSGSLFDIVPSNHSHPGADTGPGHMLFASNMVARVWDIAYVAKITRYIDANYDEKPVDWLIDEMCRTSRRITLVMEPNPVRHRGAVSSFTQNKREGLLT